MPWTPFCICCQQAADLGEESILESIEPLFLNVHSDGYAAVDKEIWPVTFLSSPPNQTAAGVLRLDRSCPAALPHGNTNDLKEWFE